MASQFDRADNRVSLDGEWSLYIEGEGTARRINVPGSWQSQFPDLRHYGGKGIYKRSFFVPMEWKGKAITLHFGAVDWFAEVSLNGVIPGSHEGGYTPFEFRIEDNVQYGADNEITVNVIDPAPDKPIGGFNFAEIPHGKQTWYGLVSGIWQSVYIEARNSFHIRNIKLTPDIDAASVDVRITFSSPASDGDKLVITIPEADIKPIMLELKAGQTDWAGRVSIPNAKLWTPDEPNLYTATARIEHDGIILDQQSTVFGMRKIAVEDGKLLLNNEPIYLISALDQDFYPKTHYTPPSEEYIRDQFIKAKELGLNSLRCHIKAPDPRYLDMADEIGLLIWYEIPNWDVLTDNSKRRGRQTLTEMVERDWNHPSIIAVSIINEEWGIKPREEASHRAWLAEMYDYAKSITPGWLVVDNSPCGDSIHVKTDIDDFHYYLSIPDHYRQFAAWIAEFASHPKWTFSQHGDARRTGHEPLILSEFGNWGLPSVPRIREYYSGDPWWMNTGVTAPKGAADRFDAWDLADVFGDWDGMAQALQEQEWRALKYQIEEMRKHSSIVGYVITEFTDLQWECNGLLDYLRNPKSFHDRMTTVQAQDIIIPEWTRTSYWSGETIELPVSVSHFSRIPISGCKLRWRIRETETSGVIDNISVDTASTARVGVIRAKLPELQQSSHMYMDMQLLDSNNKTLAANCQEFVVISEVDGQAPPLSIYSPTFNDAQFASQPSDADLLVVERLNDDVLKAIESGASAIVIIKEADSLGSFAGLEIKSRHENGWFGDWCNSAIWFRPGLFEGLPARELLDFAFSEAIPTQVITGLDPEKDRDDVLSGIFVGWVQLPAAIAIGLRHGKGRILLTTLPLTDAYGKDPFTTAALNKLMAFAASDGFQPKRTV